MSRRRRLPFQPRPTPERRTAFLGVHLTRAERETLEALAARSGRNLSDFSRDVLLSLKPEHADAMEGLAASEGREALLSLNHAAPAPRPSARDFQAIRALAAQFGRLGNNINQLTRWANEYRAIPAQKRLDEMATILRLCAEKVLAL